MNDDNKLMSILDYPKTIENDKFALIENKGTEKERILGAYDTEIQALRIYKNVSHNRKVIIPANIIYHTVHGMKILCGYEEI